MTKGQRQEIRSVHIQRKRGQESKRSQSQEPGPGNPHLVGRAIKNALSKTLEEGFSAEKKCMGEIMDPKQGPEGKTPNSIKDWQVEVL